jgi:hypothetical protein
MFNLNDTKQSYIIVSPEIFGFGVVENNIACERACSVLYSRDYILVPISTYDKGMVSKSFIGVNTGGTNDTLREDSIYLLEMLGINNVIVKYKDDDKATLIKNDGSETMLELKIYDSNLENKTFIHNGVSFTFNEMKKYYFPKKESDIKKDMTLEFFNNNRWIKKKVVEPKTEYEKMYKLLMKYEKLRVEV